MNKESIRSSADITRGSIMASDVRRKPMRKTGLREEESTIEIRAVERA